MKRMTPFALLASLSACTTPADVSKPISTGGEPNARATIHDTGTGFTVEIAYSRYQFIPETTALLLTCKSILTARAYQEAKQRGRDIDPINEQEIRVSTGRNIINARTACRAFVEAHWTH